LVFQEVQWYGFLPTDSDSMYSFQQFCISLAHQACLLLYMPLNEIVVNDFIFPTMMDLKEQ
jgi:hypothetical protein